jgi:type II secretory pathway pseudopilin PulG
MAVERGEHPICVSRGSDGRGCISGRGGFSILEALIAILVLALVLIGAAPAFFYGSKLMQRASRRRAAVERAADKMDSLMHRDFGQIRNATANITVKDLNATMTVGVADQSWEGKKVRVRVHWTFENVTSDVELTSLVSRVGAGR